MKIKISLPILLTVIFLALKVSGVIAWSWLWVLSPLWIPFALSVMITLVVFIAVKGDATKMEHIADEIKKITGSK